MKVPAYTLAAATFAAASLVVTPFESSQPSAMNGAADAPRHMTVDGRHLAAFVAGRLTTPPPLQETSATRHLPPVIPVHHVEGEGPEIIPAPTIPKNRSARRTVSPNVDAAELISIKFKGYEDISGDYRINADGTISVPVLGRVNIANQAPADLEKTLAEKVFQLTGRQSYVTVEVVRYRPVFVTGLVAKADSFPWTRNMTVLQAETLAGGIYRNKETSIIGTDKQQSVIDRSLVVLKRSIAKLARILAERNGSEKIKVPEDLVQLVGIKEAKRLIANEQDIMRNRDAALKTKRNALEAARQAAQTEITGLQGLKKTVEKQVRQRGAIAKKVGRLARRGLITDSRMADIEGKVVDFNEKLARIRVSKARAEAALLKIRRELVDINEARRVELDEEMVTLQDDIQEHKIELETARRSLTKLAINEGKQPGNINTPKITYEVVRNSGGQIRTFPADRFTPLIAGDVLVVGIEGRMPRRPGSLAPGSSAARTVGN